MAQPLKGRVQRRLSAFYRLQENTLHKFVIHIADQADFRLLQHHGYGGGLVSAQLEIPSDSLDKLIGSLGSRQPFLELGASQSFI